VAASKYCDLLQTFQTSKSNRTPESFGIVAGCNVQRRVTAKAVAIILALHRLPTVFFRGQEKFLSVPERVQRRKVLKRITLLGIVSCFNRPPPSPARNKQLSQLCVCLSGIQDKRNLSYGSRENPQRRSRIEITSRVHGILRDDVFWHKSCDISQSAFWADKNYRGGHP
jgi:hypothetical protein